MFRNPISRRVLVAAIFLIGGFSGVTAKADDAAPNLKYTAWAKYKPGSTETIAGDIDSPAGKMHLEMVRTLISVTDDQVVVETKTKMDMGGQTRESPAVKETIKATGDKDEIKQTGEESVDAMGKTFKCKVYEAAKTDSAPATPAAPGPNMNKAKVWACEDVPGGVVKLEATGRGGKSITFTLTAMEAK
jgi:hypothetical protein